MPVDDHRSLPSPHEGRRDGPEVVPLPLVHEGLVAARRAVPEAEVLAHDDLADVKPVDEHPVDELLGIHRGHGVVEVQDVDRIGTRSHQQLDAVRHRRQRRRRVPGPTTAAGCGSNVIATRGTPRASAR